MASALAKTYLTPEEYLAIEREAEHKSEYHGGQIYALTGATQKHNRIVANLIGELYNQFKGSSCSVYPSDMRIQVERSGPYVYPDVVVTCGEEKFLDDQGDVLLNPTVVIEVLSKSSEEYDHGTKAMLYRQIPSLTNYVVIAQTRPMIELWERQTHTKWLFSEIKGLDATMHLPAVEASLLLSDIYNRVTFPEDAQGHTY